ncbi:pilus assembly protein TadB, partial [Nocardioides sp.]
MSLAVWGGLLGISTTAGLALVVARIVALRRPRLEMRVLPYVRDLTSERRASVPVERSHVGAAVFGPLLRSAADLLERTVGRPASARRRLVRAGLDISVHDLRVQQVLWGLAGFGIAAAYGVLRTWTRPGDPLPLVLLCIGAFVLGVLLRDNRLSSQVRQREAAIVAEFPTVAELLALAVAAGEGPVAALDRVVRRSHGELSRDLRAVLARIRTGEPVADAFDRLAATTGVPAVARFAHGV